MRQLVSRRDSRSFIRHFHERYPWTPFMDDVEFDESADVPFGMDVVGVFGDWPLRRDEDMLAASICLLV